MLRVVLRSSNDGAANLQQPLRCSPAGKCNCVVGVMQVVFFEGGYTEYAEDWRRRNGGADPQRVKYRKMVLST